MTFVTKWHFRAALLATALCAAGCKDQTGSGTTQSGGKKSLKIAVVAKSQSNQVFQAAKVGAEDAGAELSKKLGIDIQVLWRTPNDEDAQKQAEFIEQLTVQGVDGITVSCSDASTVTNAINKAVDRGVAVMCFDSDAPESKRFAFFGVDDIKCGQRVMKELATVMGPGGGNVAVLAGNQTAPNLQKRVQGVREEASRHSNIKIVDVYYHVETPQDATAKVEEVNAVHPEINGWAMVGGWPLFTDSLLKLEPGKIKIVAVDALPEQLPYVKKGVAQLLLAQEVYDWGHKSVEVLVDKVHFKKDPPSPKIISELIPVSKDNVDEFGKNWAKWLRK